ncbi:MAG: alanine racemase, partial [Bacteroidales bacterium]
QHNLEPEIYSFRILEMLETAIKKNILPKNKPVKVHIKLDTGMHRLGFMPGDVEELIRRLHANRMVYVQSVFSHLASSEDPAEDDFTRRQIDVFREMGKRIRAEAGHPVMMHILNSAGISRFPDAQFDMVRLGISLYGISAIPEEQPELEAVARLKSVISQIRKVPAGETIGYNRAYKAEKDITMATIPVGYADGLSRILSNGRGHLLIGKTLCPVVGNISMDMCTVDVSGLDVSEGDEVIVFGPERPLQELASEMGTIPYEVLAGLSRRIKRIYYHE